MLISISVAALLTAAQRRGLEANPEQYAARLPLRELTALIRAANDAYHNTRGSVKPIMSDRAYDALKDELAERKPEHSLLKAVGAPVAAPKRLKVVLPYPMPSLDKVKPDLPSFAKWRDTHPGPYGVSGKIDGLSLELIYEGGVPVKAYTRGNGIIGQDVTRILPYIKIPRKIPVRNAAIRLEGAISKADFEKYFAKDFENARQLASGTVNGLKNMNVNALKRMRLLAHELFEPRLPILDGYKKLAQWGFEVVPHFETKVLDGDVLTKKLIQMKQKFPFEMDGLVLVQNKKMPISRTTPDHARAFKITQSDDIVQTTVEKVIWTESRYGKLAPRIQLKPVRLMGVTVTYATGHNAFFIEHGYKYGKDKTGTVKPIGPGAVVRITRAGEVTPYVVEVVKGARRPQMPAVPYSYTGNVDIELETKSDLQRDKRITNFFTSLGVEGIKLGKVQQLAAGGLDSVIKILRATPERFMQIEGFQRKSAQTLYDNIREKTKSVELHLLMAGSGAFGAGLGQRKLKALVDRYPDFLKMAQTLTKPQLLAKIKAVDLFQDKSANIVVEGMPRFLKWLPKTGIKVTGPKKVRVTGSSLKGQVVMFTGFRSAELNSAIAENGGAVGTSVNKDTTILLVKDKYSGSAKLRKAEDLGIKIMTEEEFRKKYKL